MKRVAIVFYVVVVSPAVSVGFHLKVTQLPSHLAHFFHLRRTLGLLS